MQAGTTDGIAPQARRGGTTLVQLLAESIRRHPANLAFVAPNRAPLTYAGLGRQIDATALALAKAGYTRGSRIAVAAADKPEFAVALLAVCAAATCAPLNPKLDLLALARVARVPMVLAARAELPVQTMPQLLDHARRHPGELTYASSGNFATMAMESLKAAAGVDIVVVPYRGTSPALLDVVAGRVDLVFADVASVAPQVRAGTLRLLASTGVARTPAYPELPTVIEQGMPDFVWETWQGIVAPAGIPGDVIDTLRGALRQACASVEFRAGLEQLGFEPIDEATDAFAAVVRDETERFRRLVARHGAQANQ